MLQEFLENEIFVRLMRVHVHETLELLFQEGVNFSILANIAEVDFDPPLPVHITQHFKPITMFVLAGYTYESARVDETMLVFEAGFGKENMGSVVQVPLSAILQVVIEETPILINLSIPRESEEEKEALEKGGIEKSMVALLSNPENKKLFKNS
ncbi:hypothetical protein JWV37_03915 [Sulfurospirillum sp. T05]|uniref:Flagellar assembly factor FliW n=1 Tax=Sulfurospirillum tamanense TaxID=2813362 RepID=A0ABS2WQK4_9BACT|nr:hypothetical protein [Sulfurospirillum tamanensis]MBN2963919.1 hypothetical protein [Sulfurospirillum tamanensis]